MVSSDDLLAALRSIGEATRLRIVMLLARGELNVSDLGAVLGHSQPRISRHLKLLAEAGVVERHREGSWVFFALVADGPIRHLVDHLLATVDPLDGIAAADANQLETVRDRRALDAQKYFADIAGDWDEVRSLHAPDATVEAAVVDALAPKPYSSLLDIGTGTGRMLALLGGGATEGRVVGLDSSHSMLEVARANLDRAEMRGIELRRGDIYAPPFGAARFDAVVIHQVLHFLDDPARAVAEASRLVAPGGRLLIVDFAPHDVEFLRSDHAHLRLGFRSDTVADWLAGAGLDVTRTDLIEPPPRRADHALVVALWLAERQPAPSPANQPESSLA